MKRATLLLASMLTALLLASGAALTAPKNEVDPDTLTPPPTGDLCKQTGQHVICHWSFDESWANQPDFKLSCGRAYTWGSEHAEGSLWYSHRRLVRIFGIAKTAGSDSLSPTGEGPTARFVSHRNWVDHFAVPGDFDSVTEIEHGLDTRYWGPGSGVMFQLAGIFVFPPSGAVTHHGAGKFALDDEGNLVLPAKSDAALCEALQP